MSRDPEEDLDQLSRRIAAIEAAARAPLEPNEVRAYQSISSSFDENDWLMLTRVARAVARQHRTTLNVFLGEIGVTRAVVDALAEPQVFPPEERRQPVPKTIAELAAQIDEQVKRGEWLVSIPLANCRLPSPLMKLDENCFLISADESSNPPRWSDHDDPRYELRRQIGEMVNIRPRWLHTSLLEHPLDTRMACAMVLVVGGPEPIVAQVAQATADYILAGWMLFVPPGHRRLWPTAGPWAPQPSEQFSILVTPFRREQNDLAAKHSRTGCITHYGEYEVPGDLNLLSWPLRAVRAAERCHAARALLSATWAWQHAARGGSVFEVTDIMFYAFTCLATLCEDPETQRPKAMFKRWDALQQNVPGLFDRARDAGLDKEAIDHARQTLQDARNLAAHGSDAVLVNLGFPSARTRMFPPNREVPGIELGLASLHAALRPSLWLLREVLLHCWAIADESEFNDAAFDALFATTG